MINRRQQQKRQQINKENIIINKYLKRFNNNKLLDWLAQRVSVNNRRRLLIK